MTKEDFIKQEWRKIDSSIDVSECDSIGSLHKKRIPLNSLKKHLALGNLIFGCNDFIIPKSLEGIEKNNGWLKIESENDFIKIIEYDKSLLKLYYFTNKGIYESNDLSKWIKTYKDLEITHYRFEPIFKPEPPIY